MPAPLPAPTDLSVSVREADPVYLPETGGGGGHEGAACAGVESMEATETVEAEGGGEGEVLEEVAF